MTQQPVDPIRRWAALGLFVILPLALLVLAAANLVAVTDLRARETTTTEQIGRYAARLAALPADGRAAAPSAVYVAAPSRSLAEADLQRRLVALVETASARVVESGSGSVPETEASELIEIRVTLDGDNADLLRFLYAVETGLPLMEITDLAVRRLQSEESDLGADPELRIDVVIRAPWKAVTS